MINFYCRTCGLYISVPGDFAGGKGSCPRCRVSLIVPHPISPDFPDFVEGLRYFSQLGDVGVVPEGRPEIATDSAGSSTRYKCSSCGEEYESIGVRGWTKGKCPRCAVENPPAVEDVPFPREYGSAGSPPEHPAQIAASAESWEMDGEFLVAHRSKNQIPNDSVIQGLPLLTEREADAPGLGLDEARKYSPVSDSEPASLSRDFAREGTMWHYLWKGKRHGPITMDGLKQLLHKGKVNHSVSVWREGMGKWQPIDTLEELTSLLVSAEEVSSDHEISSLQRIRKLSYCCSSLFWMFLAVACLIFVLHVTKQTLVDMGKIPFLLVNIAVAVVILLAVCYEVFEWVKNRSFLPRLARGIRIQGVVGLAGLLVCLVMTLVLMASWGGEGAVKQEERLILQAQRVFFVLRGGDVQESYKVVEWEKLKVNGEDFGSRFQAAPTVEEREKVIKEVFDLFLKRFAPSHVMEGWNPLSLKHWYVEKRTPDETVVSVKIPKLGKKIFFTIQAGELVGLKMK